MWALVRRLDLRNRGASNSLTGDLTLLLLLLGG